MESPPAFAKATGAGAVPRAGGGLHLRRWQAEEILQVPTAGVPGKSELETDAAPHAAVVRLLRRLLTAHRSGDPWWAVLRGVQAVWITGGGSTDFSAQQLTAELGCPVLLDPQGSFGGEAGGLSILRGQPGMICDLGQSALKVSWGAKRRRFPRDMEVLPLHGAGAAASIPAQRALLRQFVAEAIRLVCQEGDTGLPASVIFALPCWFDGNLTPDQSSYTGLEGDNSFVSDTLEQAGITDTEVFVLNDARLAAVSAMEDHRVLCYDKMLVLTAGYAYGAALVDVPGAALRRLAGWPQRASPV